MHRQNIIIINGSNEVGKDTFIEHFTHHCWKSVFNVSTIENVKVIANNCMGWDGVKDEKGRRFLSDLKNAWTRYNDGPFADIVEAISYYDQRFNEYVIFVHIREPAEINKLKKRYPDRVTTMLIKDHRKTVASNSADQGVNSYKNYHYIIDNSTTEKSLIKCASTLAGVFS